VVFRGADWEAQMKAESQTQMKEGNSRGSEVSQMHDDDAVKKGNSRGSEVWTRLFHAIWQIREYIRLSDCV
jgi:hypothetical protein